MIKLPIILLFISFILNCNQPTDSNSKNSNQNKMLSTLLTEKNGSRNKNRDLTQDKDLFEVFFYENNKMKEYHLKLAIKLLLETTSKTITLPEETIACTITGNIKIATSIDLNILASTDRYNKTAELSNEKKTVTYDNCSNHENVTIKSGTITHTQTTKSKLTIATASNVLTETISEGVESISGSKVTSKITRNGLRETTEKFSNTFTTTKRVNTYTVDITNITLTSYTPVSVVGVFGGTITHISSNGEKLEQVNKTINKTF